MNQTPLLRLLLDPQVSSLDIAESLHWDAASIEAFLDDPATMQVLQAVERLEHLRQRLVAISSRSAALASLTCIAQLNIEARPEAARKAASAILNFKLDDLELTAPPSPPETSPDPEPDDPYPGDEYEDDFDQDEYESQPAHDFNDHVASPPSPAAAGEGRARAPTSITPPTLDDQSPTHDTEDSRHRLRPNAPIVERSPPGLDRRATSSAHQRAPPCPLDVLQSAPTYSQPRPH